ncbi:hypothetical protein ACFSZQ_02665 [Sphingobacterium arenae]
MDRIDLQFQTVELLSPDVKGKLKPMNPCCMDGIVWFGQEYNIE